MTVALRSGVNRWQRRAAVLVGMTCLAGCSPAKTTATPLPGPPPEVTITMREYAFDHDELLPRGRVVVKVPNAGQLPHELVLAGLPDDAPPIDQQLRGTGPGRGVLRNLAIVPPHPPGSAGIFAMDLVPGRYALMCFVADADGSQHSVKGMSSEFRVA